MNYSDRHLRFGWWSLFAFLALGVILETLHGFKIGWYLDAGNETRRLMFTLAHAHGALFAGINLAAGLTMRVIKEFTLAKAASTCLLWGSLITPLGFFLGGIQFHAGDPGMGILLVPIGAVLLLFSVASAARAMSRIH